MIFKYINVLKFVQRASPHRASRRVLRTKSWKRRYFQILCCSKSCLKIRDDIARVNVPITAVTKFSYTFFNYSS